MTCAPSEDSDQPGHLPSLTSLCCTHEETMGPWLALECTVKTDQTGWMPRLIRVIAGRTGHFVGFAVLWPIYFLSFTAVCWVSGHYHFSTFDGLYYSFVGLCKYVIVQSDESLWNDPDYGLFEVVIEGIPCGSSGLTCTYMTQVTIGQTTMKLIRGSDLEIGTTSVIADEYHNDGNKIAKNGNSIEIINYRLGIVIVYDERKY